MSRPDCPETNEASPSARVTACMTAFASAIKNITVYPADHPRVVERATAFIDEHQALGCQTSQLLVKKDELEFDGTTIATDHLAVEWLQRRCRETGVGAIHIEHKCQADDVIAFASALIECRPGSGVSLADTWRDETAPVRPVALVVAEHRDKQSGSGTGTRSGSGIGTGSEIGSGTDTGATPQDASEIDPNAPLQDKLKAIANLPSVRALAQAIAEGDDSDEEATESVDMLALITEVLPVDCPTDPQGLQDTIEDILQRTHQQLQTTPRTESDVRSANLLRSAVGIAKTYFGRSNRDANTTPQQPSGRPDDDAIQADLGAFTREFATLPDASDLRLPKATELLDGAPTTTKELLGICLHGLTTAEDPEVRSSRMRTISSLLQNQPEDCTEVLTTYLTAGSRSNDIRLSLLRALVDCGLDAIVRDRNYLDDDLLRSGFPEVLPIAARAFASPDERARVRAAIEDLATMIENGGAQAVADSGLLEDVATVQLLAHCGGKIALQLLSYCESNSPHLQRALLHCVQSLELPECEQLVVELYVNDEVPPYYVRRLLRSAARNQFDSAVRSASGELLREFINTHVKEMPASTMGPAIEALKHVPGSDTEQFLRDLVKQGRFSMRPDLRELRQYAANTLDALATGARP